MAIETLKLSITADNKQAITALKETTGSLNSLSSSSTGTSGKLGQLTNTFKGLQSQAGMSSGAIGDLADSLGAGSGLGGALAIAVVSFVALGGYILKTAQDSELAMKAYDQLADALSKATGKAAGETAQLQSLVLVINDTTQSTETRKRALDELKQSYEGNIELQKIDITDGDKLVGIINKISEAILRKARAQAFSSLIAEEEAKIARLQRTSTSEAIDKVSGLNKAWIYLKNTVASGNPIMTQQGIVLDAMNKGYGKVSEEVASAKSSLEVYKQLLAGTTLAQIQNNDAATTATNISKQKTVAKKQEVDEIGNMIKAMKLEQEMRRLALGQDDKKTFGTIQPIANAPQSFSGNNNAIQGILDQAADLSRTNQAWDLYNANVAKAMSITNAIAQPFTDLAQAMLQGQQLGEALGNVFKKLAADIAAAAIKALIFKIIMTAVSGGAGAAAGIGTAAGAGMPNFMKLFGGFLGIKMATGGITQGPTPALIGEAGPEAVLPLSKLGAFIDRAAKIGASSMGGNNQQMTIGEFKLVGSDLIMAINRSNNGLGLRRGG